MKIHEIRIQAYITQDKILEAVTSGINVLRLLGVTFPKLPTKLHVLLSLLRTKLALAGKSMTALEQLPYTSDPRILATKNVLTKISSAAYYVKPIFYVLMRLKAVRMSLEHGQTVRTSASDFASYAMIIGGIAGDFAQCARFGELTLRLLERPEMGVARIRTMYTLYAGVRPWIKPLNETLAPLKQTYLGGVELGDVQMATNAAHVCCLHAFYCGNALIEVERETNTYLQAVTWPSLHYALIILRETCRDLMAEASWSVSLPTTETSALENQDPSLNDSAALRTPESKTISFAIYTNRLICSYFLQDYRSAFQHMTRADSYVSDVVAFVGNAIFYFYNSLVRLALLNTIFGFERVHSLRQIKRNQEKLRLWAQHAPENFQHKWELVDAELAAKGGRKLKAIQSYERAIRLARQHGYLHEEALSKELAGDYFLKLGLDTVARAYLQDAQRDYRRWGALAKVGQMTERYPHWLGEHASAIHRSHAKPMEMVSSTRTSTSRQLDFASVMKAMQALSQEIVLAQLLKRLMQVVTETAGAQCGVLLLKKEKEWFLEAEKLVTQNDVTVLQSQSMASLPDDSVPIPMALFHYVTRTGESLVVHDAANEKLVADDAYVQRRQPRSLLMVPILHQGNLTGLLYLENNAASGAFTESRLEVLQLLASQAAISIENARLYADMENRITARTTELESMTLDDDLIEVANRRTVD